MQNYKRPEDFDDLSLDDQGVNSRYKLKSCLVKAGFISSIQVGSYIIIIFLPAFLFFFFFYGVDGNGKQSTNVFVHLSIAINDKSQAYNFANYF